MPPQQRCGRDEAAEPQRLRQEPGQGREQRTVSPAQSRARVAPPQHRNLVTQHEISPSFDPDDLASSASQDNT